MTRNFRSLGNSSERHFKAMTLMLLARQGSFPLSHVTTGCLLLHHHHLHTHTHTNHGLSSNSRSSSSSF